MAPRRLPTSSLKTGGYALDDVLPHVPLRQFVLSLPFDLHLRAARDAQAQSALLTIFVEELRELLRGLTRRFMPCGKLGCRCQADPPKLHGPYYQWTRKVQGKTVTVRLSSAQAALLRRWISNGRRLDRLISAMERVSVRLTETLLATAARKTRR